MAVTGLNHINFHCDQPLLDAMRDFYRDVIGLSVGERPPFRNFGYWLYAGDARTGGGPIIHLWESDPGEVRALGMPQTTFDHFAFTAIDAVDFEAKLAGLGVDYRVTNLPERSIRQIFLTDPAGNAVELQFTFD